MKAPVCRLCHKEHWPRTGCDWSKMPDLPDPPAGVTRHVDPAIALRAEIAALKRTVQERDAHIAALESALELARRLDHPTAVLDKPAANTLDKPAGFDKAAYQRDLMRKRRAAAKAVKA